MSKTSDALIFLLLLLPSISSAQSEMPFLRAEEIPGLQILEVQSFAGKALYGFIDGGADLYHEYGFERLIVQNLRLNEELFFAEVYRMRDPGGAFGIFSVSHGECLPVDSLPRSSCVSPHVIQWAQSRYFVRIAAESASPEAQKELLLIAYAISKKIEGENWKVPSTLAAAGASERTVFLARGTLGMQNGFDQWSPLLEGMESFEAQIYSREDSTGHTVVGDMRFRSDSDILQFRSIVAGKKPSINIIVKSGRRILLLDSSTPADALWKKIQSFP